MEEPQGLTLHQDGSEHVDQAHLDALLAYVRRTEFKRLLNRIVLAQVEQGLSTISVLSEFSEEGRSFFISALALAYTRFLHSRVLIVETIQQTKNRSLFLQSIIGEHLPENPTKAFDDEPGYIDLLSTQSLEPGSYDTSDFQVGKYLERLRGRYDLVLVDTCATSEKSASSIDPYIIARHTDAAILVTSPQSLKKEIVAPIQRQLERMGVNLLGTVYNGFAVQ